MSDPMPDQINLYEALVRWPRVARMVEKHVQYGGRTTAGRYLAKAHNGETLYVRIVREAFQWRHNPRPRKLS